MLDRHVTVRDEFVGDFIKVVGETCAAAAGDKARNAEAKFLRLVRADVAAPPRDARAAADEKFAVEREPAVGDGKCLGLEFRVYAARTA